MILEFEMAPSLAANSNSNIISCLFLIVFLLLQKNMLIDCVFYENCLYSFSKQVYHFNVLEIFAIEGKFYDPRHKELDFFEV